MPDFATVLQKLDTASPTLLWTSVVLGGQTFFCIEKSTLDDVELHHLRSALLKPLEVKSAPSRLVQVVGDSGAPFHNEGLTRARNLLNSIVDASTALEYGYTGQYGDTNWIINDILRQNADLASRSIANVVDQSIEVLSDGTWEGSDNVGSIVWLHSRDQSHPTQFGEDTKLSDGIMTADSDDRMICLEGGLQAFRQCINALANGIRVTSISNLRQSNAKKFSAAEFLTILKSNEPCAKETYLDSCNLNAEQLNTIKGIVDSISSVGLRFRELIVEA